MFVVTALLALGITHFDRIARSNSIKSEVERAVQEMYGPTPYSHGNPLAGLKSNATPYLIALIPKCDDGNVLVAISEELRHLHAKECIPALIQTFDRPLISAPYGFIPAAREELLYWGPAAIPALKKGLSDRSPRIRYECADCLAGYCGPGPQLPGMTRIIFRLAESRDVGLQSVAIMALESMSHGTAAGTYGKTDHAHHLRECAAVTRLVRLSFDDEKEIRGKALAALVRVAGVYGDDGMMYRAALQDSHGSMEAAGREAVKGKLADPLPQVRAAAIVLANICELPVWDFLDDPDPTVADVTALVISHEGYFFVPAKAVKFARSRYAETRKMVAWLLGRRYSDEFTPTLKLLARDSDAQVRLAARDSIRRIERGP